MLVTATVVEPWKAAVQVRAHLERQAADFWQVWRGWQEEKQAGYVIENVRFEHDPDWHSRLFSIQAAADGRGIWSTAPFLLKTAVWAPMVAPLIAQILR